VLRKLDTLVLHVEVHPADAALLGLTAGQPVAVESRRGVARAVAFPSPTVPRGQVFLPMHDKATNRLTFADFDPYSRQPSYKSCAVRLRALSGDEADRLPGRDPS
jgi:assimilatory nitrate reductase catalytic subunit